MGRNYSWIKLHSDKNIWNVFIRLSESIFRKETAMNHNTQINTRIKLENIVILFIVLASLSLLILSFPPSLPVSAAVRVSLEMGKMVQRAFSIVLLAVSLQLMKRRVGETVIVNGDPVCADEDFPALLEEFKKFCQKSAHKLFFLSVTDHFLEEYRKQGFGCVKYSPTEWVPSYYVYFPRIPTPDMFYAVARIQNPRGMWDYAGAFVKGRFKKKEPHQ